MGLSVFQHFRDKAVGPELARILPVSDKPWYKKPKMAFLNYCVFSLFLLSSANGYDGSMMNGLQALPQWQTFMDHPKGAWLGFINGAQNLGGVIFFPFVAWHSNKFGRKLTIGWAYLCLAIGVGLQTGAKSHAEFVVGRTIIGIATAFYGGAAPVLITEITYPTHRGILTSLYMCGWYVGAFLAAWTTFGTRNYQNDWAWRIPSLLQILIPVIALPGVILCPESPRYYASKGKGGRARQFLITYHAEGDQNSALAEFEYQEISRAIKLELDAQKTTTWLDMLRTKGNRHRTFVTMFLGIFTQWNGVGIASYYLPPVLTTVGVTSVTKQTMISGFLQIWNLIFAVSAAFSVDLIGRRRLFLTSCTGMLMSYILIAALSGSFAETGTAATGVAVIPFLFIFFAFFAIAFTPLLVAYPCEIWPYVLRARGLALGLTTTQCALFFNIFVNPIALEGIQWKYYIVYCCILVGGAAVIYFTFPETRGHTLEEMADVFDGPAANAVIPRVSKISGNDKERPTEGAENIKSTEPSVHVENKV